MKFVTERHIGRSLREIVEKCTFTGGVEPRPYAKSHNFKVKKRRRRHRSEQTLSYVCEAYAAEPPYKGIVRGTVTDRSIRETVEKCAFVANFIAERIMNLSYE